MSAHKDDLHTDDVETDEQDQTTVDELRRFIEAEAAALGIEPVGESNVKFVDLPDLLPAPEEYGALGPADPADNYSPQELRDVIDSMGEEELPPIRRRAGGNSSSVPAPRTPPFRPFPSHVLPEPVREFVETGAESIGCEGACLAVPMLAGLAAAIGNTRRLRLKRNWDVPAVLWSALVGDTGTAKSAAFELALRPFLQRQEQALRRYAVQMRQYRIDLAAYKQACADWERLLRGDDPVEKPVRPEVERTIVIDTTIEAVGPLLLANPRGLLLARDELGRLGGGVRSLHLRQWRRRGRSLVGDARRGAGGDGSQVTTSGQPLSAGSGRLGHRVPAITRPAPGVGIRSGGAIAVELASVRDARMERGRSAA